MPRNRGDLTEHLRSPLRRHSPTLHGPRFRFKRPDPMYIPTKSPRKLDRKRSKRLRSKTAAKNRGRREQLKK